MQKMLGVIVVIFILFESCSPSNKITYSWSNNDGNLFDAETKTLIWSVQTKTINPGSIEKFSKALIESMLKRSMEDLRNLQIGLKN